MNRHGMFKLFKETTFYANSFLHCTSKPNFSYSVVKLSTIRYCSLDKLNSSGHNHRNERIRLNSYKCDGGLWYYRDFLFFNDSPQWMFLRRRGIPRKIKFTFRLDPKIPAEEPNLDTRRNMFDSGDAVNHLDSVDFSKPRVDFLNSDELKTANDDVKKLFSLGTGSRKDIVDYQILENVQKVQRHKLDNSSPEVYVAKMTVRIRNMQELFKMHPLNKQIKHLIGIFIDKRNKKLKILRMQDINRFSWLVQTLGITYRPPKLGCIERKQWRAKVLTELTEEWCEKIKNKKLEAYHHKLKTQQETFLKEKEEILKWIEEQERKYGLTAEKN